MKLIDVERFAEAERIPEVLRRLAATQVEAEKHPLAHRDGLACFNHLYTVITGQVQDDYLAGKFASGDFITRLDVMFANRYLGAVDAETTSAPSPWRCLLERRSDGWVSPLAFAVVGVSAHVNFDLAFAVVETGAQMGQLDLVDHNDYQHLNAIFFREMHTLRHRYEDGTERWLERTFGLIGGDISHGAMSLDQMFSARPMLGYGNYRGPLRGLYMCSAGTHPGGGVTGAPGHNAAREVLADFRRGRLRRVA